MEILEISDERLDEKIKEAVQILNKHGFRTFQSCQGTEGHFFQEPTIDFYGSEFDLIRAYDICRQYNLLVMKAKRVYMKSPVYSEVENGKDMGDVWQPPYNQLTFKMVNGSIFNVN